MARSIKETPKQALCREIEEELNVILKVDELELYIHITAPAFGEHHAVIMEQDCFLLNKSIVPEASAEILELCYFTLAEYLNEKNKAPGAIKILEILKADNRID